MKFRCATISDINKINDLFYELDTDTIEVQPEHFQRSERSNEYLYEIINDNKSDFLLVIVNDEIIGFSLCIEKEIKGLSLLIPCKYTYIQDFIITKKYRNNGYGTKLFERSKQWAKEHNTKYLRLSVIPKNYKGKMFYEKNGMEEQMLTMECPID